MRAYEGRGCMKAPAGDDHGEGRMATRRLESGRRQGVTFIMARVTRRRGDLLLLGTRLASGPRCARIRSLSKKNSVTVTLHPFFEEIQRERRWMKLKNVVRKQNFARIWMFCREEATVGMGTAEARLWTTVDPHGGCAKFYEKGKRARHTASVRTVKGAFPSNFFSFVTRWKEECRLFP